MPALPRTLRQPKDGPPFPSHFELEHSPVTIPPMLRTRLYADPTGRFVHDIVLQSCRKYAGKTALVDTSCNRRFTFAEYGSLVESLAHGFISAGLAPGEIV